MQKLVQPLVLCGRQTHSASEGRPENRGREAGGWGSDRREEAVFPPLSTGTGRPGMVLQGWVSALSGGMNVAEQRSPAGLNEVCKFTLRLRQIILTRLV